MSASSSVRRLDGLPIRIPERKIMFRLGYKKRDAPVNHAVTEMIKEQEARLDSLLRPAVLYRILDYEETNRHPVFEGAAKVALCLCTIGEDLERSSAELIKDNEMLRGFILDSFGSEAAEETAIQADRIIAQEARDMGLWPSKRFSPGYGIWDIREQTYVFATLPAAEIGVRLTDTYMMVPRKSVSFRINLYRDRDLSTRKLD
jgi:hypothetical protein